MFEFKVAIGHESQLGQVPENDLNAAVRTVATGFAQEFGGCTISEVRGAWLSDERGLVFEDSTIISAITLQKPDSAWIHELTVTCATIAQDLHQDAVMLVVASFEGEMNFVPALNFFEGEAA